METEAYTFNGREYIIFPRPADSSSEEDTQQDSMVISATIKSIRPGKPDFILGRVIVDTGSSIDLMYYKMLQKMGFTEIDLMPNRGNLQSFSGEQVWPLGQYV